jgi:hypothetical protein
MSRAQLTALLAALTLGTVAPRLAAQDTSSAGQVRRDTSGYSTGAGVDTSANPSRFGATDSMGADSARDSNRIHPSSPGTPPLLRDAPGRVDAADTTGALGATDTSGMRGRHPDATLPGDTSSAKPPSAAGDSGAAATRPTGQSISPTSQPRDSV